MARDMWRDLLLPPGDEDLLWELFHENSKLSPYHRSPADEEVFARMRALHEALPYEGYPVVNLPSTLTPLRLPLMEAIIGRASVPHMTPCRLTLGNLAALLHYAYGVTRQSIGPNWPRTLRAAPSGGALYPLEIFFHSAHIEGLQVGLYHYNPVQNNLRLLRQEDSTNPISEALVQPNIARNASLIIFLTAIFERSVFKYGDRAYRFILLEAGHVAQNINLVAAALQLGCVNLGGFFDRRIDDLLGLDGLTHSTLYLVAVGKPRERPEDTDGAAARRRQEGPAPW